MNSPLLSCILQLCTQASGLDFFLRSKAMMWTTFSAGFLKIGCRAVLMPAAQVLASPAILEEVQWTQVLSPEQAADALYAVGAGRAGLAMLTGLCCQTVYVEGPAGLVDLLQTVAADPDIQLAGRIEYPVAGPAVDARGRGSLCFEGSLTALEPAVVVLLRIKTEETKRLGLETHVCQLRVAFAELASLEVALSSVQGCHDSYRCQCCKSSLVPAD